MIRYRCPHCAALIVAHERRAGQSSVCKACVKPHPIPADQALWLNDRGEPLHPPAAPAPVELPPDPEPIPLFDPIPVSAPTVSAEPQPAPEPAPTPAPAVSAEPAPEPPVVPAAPEPAPEPVPPAVVALESRPDAAPEIQLPDPPAEPSRVEPIHIEPPAPVPEPVVTIREPDPVPPAPVAVPVVAVREPDLEPEPAPAPVPVVTIRAPEPEPAPAPNFGRSATAALPARPASVVAAVGHADDSVSQAESTVGTLTPPPSAAHESPSGRPLPLSLSAAAVSVGSGRFAPAADTGYADPVQLQTQADIAVALTAALTSRMKPPAAPRRDLRPSTAGWMLLTGVGVVLAVLGLFGDPAYRWAALAVGVVQIAVGYVWIVRLTKFRDPTRGALCMIPPITLVYLVQYKYARCRPLRFVATGAALVGLALLTPSLRSHTKALVGRNDAPAAQPDPATLSKLEQLRVYRDQRSYDALSRHLELLARTDAQLSVDAKDRAALSAELKGLCEHPDTNVKVRAMAAYARWDPAGARAVCLAAVRSPSADEREWALRLLPQWKDAESARAVQSLIGRPGTVETNRAKAALEEIGGVPAEQAAIALLNRAEDQGTKLAALSVLEKVGGVETASWLRASCAAAVSDPAVRDRALAASDAIAARLRVPAPAPNP